MSKSDICFSIDKFNILTNRDIEITRLLKKDIFKQADNLDYDFHI